MSVADWNKMVSMVRKLTEENEKLKQENSQLNEDRHAVCDALRHASTENKQLREALKKCSPMLGFNCQFCGAEYSELHSSDCKYMALTKDGE